MLTSHLVKYDHTVTWCLVQIHMCFVLFITSNELGFAKAYYQSFYLYLPLNSKVFELRKTCSPKLLMSILGCGYFAHLQNELMGTCNISEIMQTGCIVRKLELTVVHIVLAPGWSLILISFSSPLW